MQHSTFKIIIFILLFCYNPIFAQDLKTSENTDVSENITAVEQGLRYRVHVKDTPVQKMNILDRMKHYHVPGISIAVINKGRIEWTKGYGGTITSKTVFQAGSISKMIAAVGALKLVDQGKVSLDEDVNHYLKSWRVPENEFTKTEKVTLRRLLSHSAGTSVSGFPGYERGGSIPSTLQVLEGEAPANTDPVRVLMTPGEKFQYSGGGTTIVQQLIEDVTNTPFQTWMKENVLDPLGMHSSTYEQPFSEVLAPLATHGHLQNGKEVEGYWHIYPEMAAAGLWTTSSDLATFLISFQSILSADVVQEILKPQMLISGSFHTGLGIFIRQNAIGFTFEHSGLDHGFSARVYMLPDQEQGFVMMTNADANGWYLIEEVMNSISDVYHWPNSEPIERIARVYDFMAYKNFLGRYHLVEYAEEILDIYTENDKLFLRHNNDMPAMQLHFEKESQYFTKEENQTLSFKKNSEDNIELMIHFNDDQIFGQIFSYVKEI